MAIPEYFISCDWGTSNFRLTLVKGESLEIISEHKTEKGVKVLYNEFLEQKKLSQTDFFSNYLLSQMQVFPKQYQSCLIVSSGMVTSNIGLHNMDYAEIPFDSEGANFVSKKLQLNYGLEILLISGVKNNQGMMRGEETQAIGLEAYLKPYQDVILILPGTHSKHITYNNGGFTNLKNYMTGELFEILSQKSILSNSIVKVDKDEIMDASFTKGLKLGSEGKLTERLFSIRANDLFGKSTKEENYYFLSGLLIGDELSYLNKTTKKVFLGCPYPLANLYEMALDYIIGKDEYMLFESETVAKAMLIGQQKILKQYD